MLDITIDSKTDSKIRLVIEVAAQKLVGRVEELTMSGQSASTRSPKVGLFLPTGEIMLGGATAGWSQLLELAQRAENLGFVSLWLPDHFLLGSDGDSEAIGA